MGNMQKLPDDRKERPNYLFLKRGVDGKLQIEIPSEYAEQFEPISEATYKRWLKEMSEDPKHLEELRLDEVDETDEED